MSLLENDKLQTTNDKLPTTNQPDGGRRRNMDYKQTIEDLRAIEHLLEAGLKDAYEASQMRKDVESLA